MSPKDVFAQQLETQIAEWQKHVSDYQAMVHESTGQLRATHEKNLEAAKSALKQAQDMHERICKANESAWKQMQASTENAVKELTNGWMKAISSYRSDK